MPLPKLRTYTNREIAYITGLTDRAVLFYNSLVPAIEGTGQGRGNPRRYDSDALFRFLVIKQLADHGVTIAKMPAILKECDRQEVVLIASAPEITREKATEITQSDRARMKRFIKFCETDDPENFPEKDLPEWDYGEMGPDSKWWNKVGYNVAVLKIMSFRTGKQKVEIEIIREKPTDGDYDPLFFESAGQIPVTLGNALSAVVINLHRLAQITHDAFHGAFRLK